MSDFMQWVTHGIKRGRFEMSSRTALYVLAPVIVLTLVASLYLMLIGRTAARGRYIEELRVELFRLQRENEQLEVEIAEEGSVSPLLGRAIELGFTSAERVEFLPPAVEDP